MPGERHQTPEYGKAVSFGQRPRPVTVHNRYTRTGTLPAVVVEWPLQLQYMLHDVTT